MKLSRIILFILFAVLLLYAYTDVMSSRQAGFRDQDRGLVYIYLGIIIILLSLYNILYGHRSVHFKNMSIILWIITIWITIVNIINVTNFWNSIVHISMGIWWVMAYGFFYNYSVNNSKSTKLIITFFVGMFLFYIWANFYIRNNLSTTFSIEHSVTGYAYYFIVFVPYIALIKNVKLRNFIFGLVIIIVVTSFKRGPIIILPLMLMTFYLTKSIIRKRIVRFIFSIIPVIFLFLLSFYIVDDLSGGYLMSRFSTEELSYGSGRVELWNSVIYSIKQRGDFLLLVGSGSGSSVALLGTGVHNEWLEFFYNFGIIGVLLYLIMCIIMIHNYVKLLTKKSLYAPHVGMVTIYVICVGLFSQFFLIHSTFYIFAFLGFVENLQHVNDHILNEKKN